MRSSSLLSYLLDTNILLRYIRGDSEFIAELESRFALFTGRNRVFIPYVVLGEIRVIGEQGNWNADKWASLNRLTRVFPRVDIVGDAILDAYVAVDTFNRYSGRDMGSKNDIWIAATALVYGTTLLTTDKDFDHLEPVGVDVEWLTI